MKPIHVDTVYCTTDWTDVRPYYIIRKNDKAADYEWYVRMQVGDLTREDAGKEQLASVCAFQSGMLFGYLFDRQQFGVGFVRQTVRPERSLKSLRMMSTGIVRRLICGRLWDIRYSTPGMAICICWLMLSSSLKKERSLLLPT